ncbi:MAG TPA: 2-hydroxychromene-2-carboxylate isomerase [Kofleriaceae bacterium]|nr:2-hydroxychromene-2-carboxylate isomerase [Kofleriaceae bacterium]
MTDREPVRFLFDYLSPYAYIAWTQVHALAGRYGRTVEPVPILFAALLGAHGHKGPAEIPPKRLYTFKHVLRLASRFGIPLSPPPSHPFNPLLALRVSSLPMPDETRRALVDRLYAATWAGGPGVEDPATVARLAGEAGLDGAAAVEQARSDEAKARLRAQTEAALAAGAFGVPTFLVGRELFWGCDSMPDVELHLRGEDPVSDATIARWAGLPATASRI